MALDFGVFDFSSGKALPSYLSDSKRKKKLSNEELLKKVGPITCITHHTRAQAHNRYISI